MPEGKFKHFLQTRRNVLGKLKKLLGFSHAFPTFRVSRMSENGTKLVLCFCEWNRNCESNRLAAWKKDIVSLSLHRTIAVPSRIVEHEKRLSNAISKWHQVKRHISCCRTIIGFFCKKNEKLIFRRFATSEFCYNYRDLLCYVFFMSFQVLLSNWLTFWRTFNGKFLTSFYREIQ